jgi:cholesterol oxidase
MSLTQARGKDQQYLNIDWAEAKSGDYYDRVRDTSRSVAGALGAKVVQDPLMQSLHRPVTVHPLGGCPMGRDPAEGVVDSYGRVFGCPGLYVADGSVMPGPVGPNPSLTIAALADRFADAIVAARGT